MSSSNHQQSSEAKVASSGSSTIEKNETKSQESHDVTEDDNNPTSTIEKKLREKKQLPSVKYLLEHGDPDSPPPTLKDTIQLMVALTVTFVASLILWHFLFLKGSAPGKAKNWGRDEI